MNHLTTRTGLRIGCMATKAPPVHHDADALRLQRALLGEPAPVDKDGLAIVIGTLATMALIGWMLT